MSVPEHVKASVATALTLLPPSMGSRDALVMLYTIGLQESRFVLRAQVVQGQPGKKGPARGYWQFERGGGVHGVMTHIASKALAETVCKVCAVPFDEAAVWERLETDDVLAAAFARLLLYTDPFPLPRTPNPQRAWEYYVDNWRPGRPHRSTWNAFYVAAQDAAERRKGER